MIKKFPDHTLIYSTALISRGYIGYRLSAIPSVIVPFKISAQYLVNKMIEFHQFSICIYLDNI